MPAGPLMSEHRLIERVVPVLKSEIERLNKTDKIDTCFISAIVDFFRTYADKCHHGKEEDILFKALAEKPLEPRHKDVMRELLAEHVMARKLVGSLESAKDLRDVENTAGRLKDLSELYPIHIDKEDRHFFIPVMKYFTKQEQADMLFEFREFDGKMIHEKYRSAIGRMEKNK